MSRGSGIEIRCAPSGTSDLRRTRIAAAIGRSNTIVDPIFATWDETIVVVEKVHRRTEVAVDGVDPALPSTGVAVHPVDAMRRWWIIVVTTMIGGTILASVGVVPIGIVAMICIVGIVVEIRTLKWGRTLVTCDFPLNFDKVVYH
jgi:hypothetical protein